MSRARRHARICDNNQLDDADITAPINGSFPFSNCLDAKNRARVYKPSSKSFTIQIDMYANKQCSFFAIFGKADGYFSFSNQAVITIKANMINLFTGGEPFTKVASVTDKGAFADLTDVDNPTGQQYRYWQVVVSDTTNPNDLELAYFYLGDHIDFQFNANQQFQFEQTDLTRRATSDAGVVYSIRKNQYSIFSAIGFSYLGADDRRKIQSTAETLGLSIPFVFVLDPLEIGFEFEFGTLLCYFEKEPQFTQAYLNKFNIAFALREVV